MLLEKMEEFEQGSVGRRVSMLHRLCMVNVSGPLSELGIGSGKLPFLMKIQNCEGIIQEDLTQSLCLDRAATARALQDLESKGLVYREEDQQDRRRKRVYSTAKTKSLRKKLIAILKEHNEALFTGFDDEEKLQFLSMLDRLIENMHVRLGR
ncbi:MarR family winged helix-turn-helix transcriptional regulator [Halodesulfovibrio aestuarii]|uniref:MarR family winged helix-turn-helix transcriptional regulator n=1 Tax=Halodesulfovibrio aestuarii TaxID=126333 RepID=A0ABV4JUL0_9BACT